MVRRPTAPSRSQRASRRVAAARTSRRGPLSRDAILEAALIVVQREGVEGFSIRKLAAELGVTPMAVYHHVHNKQEILVGVIDRVVGEAAVTAHAVPHSRWQDWLRATFGAMYRALLEQPGVMPLLGNSLRVGPSALSVLDEVLGVLRQAGLDQTAAVRGFHALMSYTVGAASLQAASRVSGQDGTRAGAEMDPEALASLRHLVDLAEELDGLAGSDPFAAGLETLLAGLASQRRE